MQLEYNSTRLHARRLPLVCTSTVCVRTSTMSLLSSPSVQPVQAKRAAQRADRIAVAPTSSQWRVAQHYPIPNCTDQFEVLFGSFHEWRHSPIRGMHTRTTYTIECMRRVAIETKCEPISAVCHSPNRVADSDADADADCRLPRSDGCATVCDCVCAVAELTRNTIELYNSMAEKF